MELSLISDSLPDLLPMTNRSPGIHVSEVVNRICVERGLLRSGDNSPVLTTTWAQFGHAFEHAVAARYELQFPDRYVRIGELELDGIFGTPDLYDSENHSIEEIKLSWMTSATDPEDSKFARYWMQLKAYCWMIDTNVGRLHVCHVNGDYNRENPFGPTSRLWEAKFDRMELLTNWTMIRTWADRMSMEAD